MKKTLIITIIILSLLMIPIIAEEVTVNSVVDSFLNSARRMTKEEVVTLQSRVTPEQLQGAVGFATSWQSLKVVTLEMNNIIIERQDNARVRGIK